MKIALFSDLHYPAIDERISGLLEARSAFYEKFIDQFLKVDAELHVSLGDLTNYGMRHELENIYSLIGERREFIHVLGNHDNYSMTKNELLTITGQKRYSSFETEQAIFAFLDTARELDHECWGGWMDDEQLDWLEHVIQNSEEKPLLIFAHHPVHNTTAGSERENGSIHPSINMRSLLHQKKGIGMYFNGHMHCDSIVKEGNWTFVQTAACLDQPAFRLINIADESITVTAIDVDDETLRQNAQRIYDNINHFTHRADARGEHEHRNCEVSLVHASTTV
ncbi:MULTISPECIES: metallophosphoesterase [Sporosarcina]|uniref:Metallophosphoesterase family protein n=1 Tax=Sporosarcina contaminans TaxID=633403 RepID=A0ABW3U1K2_9BACL